jgi:hypothetical protein
MRLQPPDDVLFEAVDIEPWRAEWQGMPAYEHEDLAPKFTLKVHFACQADVDDFLRLIGQSIVFTGTKQLPSIWFPDQDDELQVNRRYIQAPR